MKKKFYGYLSALLLFSASVLALNGFQNTSYAADTSPNAIITGGITTTAQLKQRCDENFKGDLQNILRAYGINCADVPKMVAGTALKNGDITVGGQVVATGSQSIGRSEKSYSHPKVISGVTYHESSSTSVFRSEQLPVFVLMNGNTFVGAVILDCGNPITGNPKTPPPPPPPVTPKAEYKCDSLKATKISRTNYRFVAAASGTNATLTEYRVDFGDDSDEETFPASQPTFTHEYDEPGTYTAVLTAVFDVNGMEKTATSNACKVTIKIEELKPNTVERCDVTTRKIVTVTEEQAKDTERYAPVGSERCEVCPYNPDLPKDSEECKPPVTPPVVTPPQVLPDTGPAELAIGGIGLSSLTAAGYYWRASRRQLISKLLNR